MSDKDNSGAIWPNKRREKDTHPHFTGQATIGGVEYWVSAWKKDDDAKPNAPSLRFSVKPKDDKPARQEPAQSSPDFDDDVPF